MGTVLLHIPLLLLFLFLRVHLLSQGGGALSMIWVGLLDCINSFLSLPILSLADTASASFLLYPPHQPSFFSLSHLSF